MLQTLTAVYANAQGSLTDKVSYIQYEVTAIEHRDGDKIEEYSKLVDKATKLVE
ncbi:MAG: hypothetical protein IT292_05170 [Deltaproteobacteria bacterium]|nr:hypothetical protein [Deltaproteobacteria bacterium]